jgi:hypothetical protein
MPQLPSTEASLEYPPTATGDITAVAAGDVRLWARTASEILHSDNDGRTWTREALPTSLTIGGIILTPEYDLGPNGNDRATLAAFDDRAFVIFHKPDSVKAPDWSGSPLLVYTPDAVGARRWIGQWTHDNDGRGLGGRRFVRAFHLFKCSGLEESIGQRFQLFYGSGQGVQQAESLAADGHVEFHDPILTHRPLEKEDPRSQTDIHADLWDMTIASDYCPQSQPTVWLAADGGVYQGTSGSGHLWDLEWRTHSDGLHLHNAHDVRIVRASGPQPTLLGYPTTDNGAWFRNRDGTWSSEPFMGDANFAASDTVSPLAVIWRQPWGGGDNPMGVVSGLGLSFLGSGGSRTKRFELNRDTTFDGPTALHAVIPLTSEIVNSDRTLDVVLLNRVPLTDAKGGVVRGQDAAGKAWPTPTTPRNVILRNPVFTVHTDASADQFRDWRLVSDSVPAGARQLWTAGGLVNTRYYVLGDRTTTAPSGLSMLQGGTWTALGGAVQFIAPLSPDDQGPIFPNPYNPNVLIAAYLRGGVQMIGISRNGGQSFCDSGPLTALLTDSGNVALSSSAIPTHFLEIGGTFHGPPGRLTPVSVAFDPADTNRVFIAAAEARLVTANLRPRPADILTGNPCPEPIWYDLSPAFRAPRPYISAVRYDAGTLFVSTHGRGILSISMLDRAREAAWFGPSAMFGPGQPLANLRGGSGTALPYGYVTATLVPIGSCPGASTLNESHRTDENGAFVLTAKAVSGCQYRVDLEFRSDGLHEPSRLRFRSTSS